MSLSLDDARTIIAAALAGNIGPTRVRPRERGT